MACITLFAQHVAMATTQLARVFHYEDAFKQLEYTSERNPLCMSWVVVTSGEGGQTLQMHWTRSADPR